MQIDAVFARIWAEHQDDFRSECAKPVVKYSQLFKRLVRVLASHIDEDTDRDHELDAERVTVIDHGDYQGMQVFVVGTKGSQPSTYWATNTFYGSCSGCDTLSRANDQDEPERRKEYMTMMLHMMQRLRKIT